MRNKIKHLRKERSLRQEDVANLLGVTRQTILAIENDKYNPTLELAMRLARLLGATVEEIFFLDDANDENSAGSISV
jgi:putative transcriptional regulator